MPRKLNTVVLDAAARDYARMFLSEDRLSPSGKVHIDGPSAIAHNLRSIAYNDEHAYLHERLRDELGANARARLDAMMKKAPRTRTAKDHELELQKRLAVTPSGDHKEGFIGRVVVGHRFVGIHPEVVETADSIRRRKRAGLRVHVHGRNDRETRVRMIPRYWPIYAGENEERLRPGGGVADNLPDGAMGLSVGAAAMGISNECAILACDAVVDNLDEGTGAAILRGYTTARATDVDTAIGAQTLLFTLVCSDPAFGGASDAAPGATATASAITSDTSADATDTLVWCRASATNDGATPLDDHIDGNAGTATSDFIFNTVAIVSGATVSMSSWTVTMPES